MDTHRIDAHRPAVLVTEDYEYVFAEVNHLEGAPGWVLRRGDFGMEMAQWISRTDHLERGTHQCHHCGARLNYFAVLRHLPTGDAVVIGETCLENRFELASSEFHKLRKMAELDRAKCRIRTAVQAFCDQNPDLAWMANNDIDAGPETSRNNDFVQDVARKLRKYGELSDRQISAIRAAIVRDAERTAQKAVEMEDAEPVPTGRIVVTGEVVSTKLQESYYSDTWKMLVRDDRGFKVWGSIPAALDVERGTRVQFTATLEPSADDQFFGFFKRPAKASVLD